MLATTILKRVPAFNELNDEQLLTLFKAGRVISLPANTILFREDDEANSLYVILAGSVKIYKSHESGYRIHLNSMGSGELLGEVALLDGGYRSATVATVDACEFYVLERDVFLEFLADNPELAFAVLNSLTKKIRETNEKRFREELTKQNIQAEMEIERHRSMAQMVAGVAHEINTPLGIINTAASIVTSVLKGPEFQELADQNMDLQESISDVLEATALMQGNVLKAHRLIQSFKNVSVSQVSERKESVSLLEVVQETMDLFSINARRAGITVEIKDNLPTDQKMWVGYRGALSQVLMNLLTNIERYAYPNAVGGHVIIGLQATVKRRGKSFIITIQDFGEGIPEENLARIFDVFFTTGRDRGGTGLGMAIVNNMVTGLMQGNIEIQSELGQGTLFTITVPQEIKD